MSEDIPAVVCWDCRPDLWAGKNVVFAPITAIYCCECKKLMDPLDQPRMPYFGSTFTLDKPPAEILKELGYENPQELRIKRLYEDYDFEAEVHRLIQKEVDKKNQEIENLLGIIRRLEKSNQELGEALHRTTEGVGWNKNP